MEELIKKHLGINTPQWIIDNCKALLIEWDSLKGYTSERQLIIPDVSVSKIEVKTKVKLIRSVGRDEGMTHPNNVLSIGEIGVVEQISSEDFKGEYPLYYVNFGSAKGYNISRFYWLRPNEVQIYSH